MKLKKPLPKNRSYDQIKNHYLAEKAIADKLRHASLKERKHIYARMYENLFNQVPDHPRFAMVSRFLDASTVFAEFGPGDCKFAMKVAESVKCVYGIDIYDQHSLEDHVSRNFKLVIYDGYNLEEIESNSIDIVFSDQLIEHLHPEDAKHHFKLVRRILKVGGKYVFRTPHSFVGPADISMYFSDKPEGFHIKEWTYVEINEMIRKLKYNQFSTYWTKRSISLKMPYVYFAVCEKVLGLFPKRNIRLAATYLIPSIHGVASK